MPVLAYLLLFDENICMIYRVCHAGLGLLIAVR